MPQTRPDSRQILNRASLAKIGAAAGTTQDSLNSKFNTELDSPLRMAASFPSADAQLNFSNSLISAADGANKVLPPVSSQVFEALTGAFINFQTQALSSAGHFTITFPSPNVVAKFRRVGFTLTSAGKIQVIFSAEAASEGALVNPGTLFVTGVPLGYINLVCTSTSGFFKTAGSATNIIENAKIYRFGAGGGGSSGSGSGVGDDINTLAFRYDFSDDLSDNPSASTSAVDSSRTNATYDAVAAAYRMSYDASKTVTGTGVNMTLSGTPAFTVVAGDVLSVGTQTRRIITVTSQTVYVLDSAFSSDPTAAVACVSQAVHSNDVRAHTENSTGLSIASQTSDTVSTFMLRYSDSAAASDAIWDLPGAALVAFNASADDSNWSANFTRITDLTQTESVRSVPVAGSQFKARFFANATSGSGAVNLLDYKAYLHQDSQTVSGSFAGKANGRTDAAGTAVNCSVASDTGKTRITTTFSFGTEVLVYLDGKKIPEFVDTTITPDAYFKRIGGNIIELDSDYSGLGLQVEVLVPSNTVDNTNANASNISAIQDTLTSAFQGMVSEAAQLNAINGTPGTGQFRTFGIVNRASIPDLANDLKARMGVDRIPTQQLVRLQNEFGPNGEPVSAALNDDRGLIRFVGDQWTNDVSNQGANIDSSSTSTTDFVEIAFFGTGLNLLTLLFSASQDYRVTVDGGSEGANILGASYASTISARSYAANQVLSIASGLALGMHTIKIRKAVASFDLRVFGFEILNESSNVNVRPGTAFVGGKKLVLSAASSVAYNSGTFDSVQQGGASTSFSTVRGARVVEYITSTGAKGKAATLTNSASATASSADHTYEDVARVIFPREFGANRSDDFSTLTSTSASARAYTLEDGTTSLISSSARFDITGGYDALAIASNGNWITINFIGTGLDITEINEASGGSDTYNVQVDGAVGVALHTAGSTTARQTKLCSGLPYGTHTVRINRVTAATWTLKVINFIVYQPKKPTIPAGAVELADYNVMADYVVASSSTTSSQIDLGLIGTGVLRKMLWREATFVGGWAVNFSVLSASNVGGFEIGGTLGSNAYMEYTFFGTGFELRFETTTGSVPYAVTLNGTAMTTANFSGLVTSQYGMTTTTAYNASTGTLNTQGTTAGNSAGFSAKGLTLGKYTVRFNSTGGGVAWFEALDIITPIHSHKSNLNADLQNTLPVGSQSISDNRRTSLIKLESPGKTWAQAQGVTSAPTTTSTTLVPCPDMSTVLKTTGGVLEISYSITVLNSSGGAANIFQIYVDGAAVDNERRVDSASASAEVVAACTVRVPATAGFHKVDVYWRVNSGTATADGVRRNMLVRET